MNATPGSVSWLINGIPRDGAEAKQMSDRQWEAQFYSNIDLQRLDLDSAAITPYQALRHRRRLHRCLH